MEILPPPHLPRAVAIQAPPAFGHPPQPTVVACIPAADGVKRGAVDADAKIEEGLAHVHSVPRSGRSRPTVRISVSRSTGSWRPSAAGHRQPLLDSISPNSSALMAGILLARIWPYKSAQR